MNDEVLRQISMDASNYYYTLLKAGLMQTAWDFAGFQVQLERRLRQYNKIKNNEAYSYAVTGMPRDVVQGDLRGEDAKSE